MNRPIRKRGYYRAVKRGEEWACRIHRMPEGFGKMMAFYMRTVDMAKELTRTDSIFNLLPKDDGWRGGTIVIPFGRQHDQGDIDSGS
jgi:hypothetical protein